MYRHSYEAQTLAENTTIIIENQATTDRMWRPQSSRPAVDCQNALQDSLPFPLSNFAPSSNENSLYGLPTRHERLEPHSRTVEAAQAARPAPRPSQNRAPFGKWKSKLISGFPTADTPLPYGITAKEICESYPNHVDDHVILALMRDGKGAKAIDALMPAPPGKHKAGQSHSKIQLRVSTIREAFPEENFPITSTKRSRPRNRLRGSRVMSSEDEDAALSTADDFWGPKGDTGKASDAKGGRIQRTQPRSSGGVLKTLQNDGSVEMNGPQEPANIGDFPSFHWSPLQLIAPSLLLGANTTSTYSTFELTQDTWHLHQTSLLTDQIQREQHRHHELVFDVYYSEESLPESELSETIRAHCAANYDAISQELQEKSGMALGKMFLANGTLEDSISYLQRSIAGCFQRLSKSQAAVDFGGPESQPGNHVETAANKYLLDRLQGWTRELETRKEVVRQIRAHKNAHTRVLPNDPDHRPWESISRQAFVGDEGSTPRSDPFQSHSLTPGSSSTTFEKPQAAGAPDQGTRNAAAALLNKRVMSDVKTETSVPRPVSFGKVQPSMISTSFSPLQGMEPESVKQASANLPEHGNYLQHSDQRAERFSRPEIRRSVSGSGLKDHTMADGAPASGNSTRHEFEAYMEESGQLVDQRAWETEMPQVSDTDTHKNPAPFLTTSVGVWADPNALSAMENDVFILLGWEMLSRHVFGVDAEAKVEQERNRLYGIGEDGMSRTLWKDLPADEDCGV